MTNFELQLEIENILNKNIKHIPYEGNEVNKSQIIRDVMELVSKLKPVSKTKSIVNFSDIFYFAKNSPYNIGWNAANDLFFRDDVLGYGKYNNIDKETLLSEIKYMEENDKTGSKLLAYRILVDFMEEQGFDEMLVLND